MTDASTTLVMSASTRSGSINGALARHLVDAITERGDTAELVDLTEYEMPMYHGDLEAADGVPAAAHDLVDRVRGAERLVIVTPEYNGAFPPLLKNTIDWMTRVDRSFMVHLTVHLAAATPGRSGGARVLPITRTWLESMRVAVAPAVLGVPRSGLDDDGEFVSESELDIATFLAPE